MDWSNVRKCKTCGTYGHISNNSTSKFEENSQADSEVSSDEEREDESKEVEEIGLFFTIDLKPFRYTTYWRN